MRSLVWFRADLRVSDNTALRAACDASDDGVIGVFVLFPGQWRDHDWAPCRVGLMMRCVRELSIRLEKLNIPLLIAQSDRFGEAPRVLLRLAEEHRCDALFFSREYEINESRRDESVMQAAANAGIGVHACHDQTVFEPGSIRTGQGTVYTVFTPFRNAWLKRAAESGPIKPSAPPRPQARTGVVPSAVPLSIPGFESTVPDALWPAGEDHARQRLRAFVDRRINDYAKLRNDPSVEATSALSPYLAVGAISPRQCIAAAAEAGGGVPSGEKSGAGTWISELIWREFYRHILVGFPRVCMHRPFKLATEGIRWRDDEEGFGAWCNGRTGYPIVDAGMRQLREMGWMHNRVRMITAMFLTKDLFIDWRRGERFFMQHLVDGDLASNNGGWQWSASTGTDAAPYFRIFNPTSQGRTNDAQGTYIRRYVPELASLDDRAIHDPPALARESLGYPHPIVDHEQARARVIREFKAIAAPASPLRGG